jgi:hypothetical protein
VLGTVAATLSFLSLPLLSQSAPQNPGAAQASPPSQAQPDSNATSQTKPSQSEIENGGRLATESDIEAAGREAQNMVPAQAILTDTLDAKKLQPGANFEATLNSKVKLADGTELPSGTVLHGTVAADDMNVKANSKLALRFNSAQTKGGQSVPVRATIVGLQTLSNERNLAYRGFEEPNPNDWNSKIHVVDQIGVDSGIDLHSNLESQNSGVFVATNKDDVKLKKGSTVNLAIAVVAPAQASASR